MKPLIHLHLLLFLAGFAGAQTPLLTAEDSARVDARELFVFESYQEIADSLRQVSRESGVPPHVLVHTYVSSRIAHFYPLWENPSFNHPSVLLYSTRFGHCGNIATAAHVLYGLTGCESRIVSLDGHVVNEVKVNGRWIVLDPNNGVSFKNGNTLLSQNEIVKQAPELSVDYLWITPNLLLKSNTPGKDRRVFGLGAGNFLDPYLSPENKGENSTGWYTAYDTAFRYDIRLPSKSELFARETGNGLLGKLLSVTVHPGGKGKLGLPFVPIFYEGNPRIKNFDTYFEDVVPDSTFFVFRFRDSLTSAYIELDLDSTDGDVTLYYLANGLNGFVRPEDRFEKGAVLPPDYASAAEFMAYAYRRTLNETEARAYLDMEERIGNIVAQKQGITYTLDKIWAIGNRYLGAGDPTEIRQTRYLFYKLYPYVYASRMKRYAALFFMICKYDMYPELVAFMRHRYLFEPEEGEPK